MDWMRKIEKKGKGILKMKASAIIAPDRIFGDVFSLYQISLDKYLDSIIIAAFAHFSPPVLTLYSFFCLGVVFQLSLLSASSAHPVSTTSQTSVVI